MRNRIIRSGGNRWYPALMKQRLLVSAVLSAAALFAQNPAWEPAPGHPSFPLWPNGAPGAPANPPAEIDTTTAKDNLIAGKPLVRLGNVSSPTLTIYSPRQN